MSNTSLCTYDGECKHCTPEQMRENAKELLDRLSAQGKAGLVYASTLARGKCHEYTKAIEIERYRRGWVNPTTFKMIGCPTFVYDALKDEAGLPPKTEASLRRYEELNHITKELPAPESALGLFVMEEELYRRRFGVAGSREELDRLTAQCETERKRAATAIGNLRTARASEEKMKHQLNKALDIIARLTA